MGWNVAMWRAISSEGAKAAAMMVRIGSAGHKAERCAREDESEVKDVAVASKTKKDARLLH